MGEKLKNVEEVDDIPAEIDQRQPPTVLTKIMTSLIAPSMLLLGYANISDYFTPDFANSLNLIYDWLGITFAAAAGGVFGLGVTKYYLGPKSFKREADNARFIMSLLPFVTAFPSMMLIYNLNIWSPAPIAVGLLFGVLGDYLAAASGKAPKFWFSFRFKVLLAAQFVVFVTMINLSTFIEYKIEMTKLLTNYEALAKSQTIQDLGTAPRIESKKKTTKKEEKKDILSDPTK